MIRLIALMLIMATPSYAQDLPALYDVSGVQATDTLNIRRAPSLQGEAFSALAHNAQRVEVLEKNGDWMRINTPEQTGWVAARFMTPNTGAPAERNCFGTEPFWSMTKTATGPFRFRILGDYNMAFTASTPLQSANDTRVRAISGTGSPGSLQVIERRQICNDGMSDASYGIAIDVLLDRKDNTAAMLYSGCCSLR